MSEQIDKLKLADAKGDAKSHANVEEVALELEKHELDRRVRELEENNARLKELLKLKERAAEQAAKIAKNSTSNNKIGARKHADFKAISTAPSINKTPIGPTMVPLPYPTVQDLSNSASTARSVRFNGSPAYLLGGTTQPQGKGDEAGTGKGIRSGTVCGEVKPVKGSSTVRIEGKQVVREGDACTMNGGNNPGIYVTTQSPSLASPKTAIATSNPLAQLGRKRDWNPDDPLGLAEPQTQAEKLSAMIRRETLDGSGPLRRDSALLKNVPTGPMLKPLDPSSATDPYLRTRTLLETQLLGIFGAPGAAAQLSGASVETVAAANQVGASAMGVVWALAGLPSRQAINVGPRTSPPTGKTMPQQATDGVKAPRYTQVFSAPIPRSARIVSTAT
jgi:uncharacterized Zn-binding protein involved in type VI secretion